MQSTQRNPNRTESGMKGQIPSQFAPQDNNESHHNLNQFRDKNQTNGINQAQSKENNAAKQNVKKNNNILDELNNTLNYKIDFKKNENSKDKDNMDDVDEERDNKNKIINVKPKINKTNKKNEKVFEVPK
jgi:hypothetical protein